MLKRRLKFSSLFKEYTYQMIAEVEVFKKFNWKKVIEFIIMKNARKYYYKYLYDFFSKTRFTLKLQ